MRDTLRTTVAAALVFAAQPAAADTVCEWMEFASRMASPLQQSMMMPPRGPDQERAATRVALAMFEALNAIDRRYASYLGFPAGDGSASQDAAAATAAYHVLLQAFPDRKSALDESYAIAMAAVSDERRRQAGRQIGEAAAKAALAAGGIDPAIRQVPYRPRTAAGVWIGASLPTIDSYWAAFRPWAIPNAAEVLRPPPPPALTSDRWARDYEEVRRLGGKTSKERTPQQTLMARYRQTPDLMPSLRLAADAPGRRPVQNARMFALVQMAVDDAIVPNLTAKLHYNFWRPITAIRNGEDDGNPATVPDPAWTPLLPTPNFPEYPCGHCTFAAAMAEVMKAEVGPRPAAGVKVSSQSISDAVVQTLPSWDAWVQDVSNSRIYGGVHYRFSNEAGEEIGRRAARMVMAKVMRPLGDRLASKK